FGDKHARDPVIGSRAVDIVLNHGYTCCLPGFDRLVQFLDCCFFETKRFLICHGPPLVPALADPLQCQGYVLSDVIAMPQTIPVLDLGDYLAGRAGALEATAARVRDALTTVGFFVLTRHDVPYRMIERAFAEAVRFHDLPIDKKLGLKLNEHVNGYMAMSRYAVWTSDVNNNDKPDLNEAFFIKRERPPDDPLRLSGRRFVGPNLWPDEADLPGFRSHVLGYAGRMDDLARRV